MINQKRSSVLISLAGTWLSQLLLGQPLPAIVLLEKTEYLADSYNWSDAGPKYEDAEHLLRKLGQDRNALFAGWAASEATWKALGCPSCRSFSKISLRTRLSRTGI